MKLALMCLALLECASSALATEALYHCANGTTIHAVFSTPVPPTGSVRLSFTTKRRPVTLPQVPSADGGRYTDGSIEFWIKGKTAQLTEAGATTECKAK